MSVTADLMDVRTLGTVHDYGDQALLLEFSSTAEVLAWADALREAELLGVLDIVPASRTVLLKLAGPRYQAPTRQRLGKLRVTAEALSEAAIELVTDAATLTAGQLHRRARQLRDDLDDTEVVDRERAQLEQQHLKAWKRADGMVEGRFLYAAEPGGFLLSVLDELTSPRRGGPRFVKEEDRARIDASRRTRARRTGSRPRASWNCFVSAPSCCAAGVSAQS